MTRKHQIILISLVILVVFGLFLYLHEPKARAISPTLTNGTLFGWAWSENIGWISFNSCNVGGNDNICETCVLNNSCSAPGVTSYGVIYDSTGYLRGYAWSENIGWIKFGGLSGFPQGFSNIVNDNAKIDPDGNMSGWARVCAGLMNGSDYSVPNNNCGGNSRTDGWDGWISLSGLNNNLGNYNTRYGPVFDVKSDTTASIASASDFAWGSDVVGWIDFGKVKMTKILITSPSVEINANPISVTIPNDGETTGQTRLSWSGDNIAHGPAVCSGTTKLNGSSVSTPWDTTHPFPAPTQGLLITGLQIGTYDFYITCDGKDGSFPAKVNVNYSSTNPPPATSCTISDKNDKTKLSCYCSVADHHTNDPICKRVPGYKEN